MVKIRTGVAVLAAAGVLVAGAAGGAVAGHQITSRQIKNHTIRGKDIHKATIAAANLTTAARASLKGARGPKGATGAKGDPGLSGFSYQSAVVSVPAGHWKTASALCPIATNVLGGGYDRYTDQITVRRSKPGTTTLNVGGFPLTVHTWDVYVYNAGSAAYDVTVYAQCASTR